MMKNSITKRNWDHRARGRRRGSVLVFVALMMPVLLGVAAMAVDMSYLYNQRALAQRAADAAALAGAECEVNSASSFCSSSGINGNVHNAVLRLAADNGFDSGKNSRVTVTDNCSTGTCSQVTTRFPGAPTTTGVEVTITKTEPTFFSGILRNTGNSVQATAIAHYTSVQPIPISPAQYGLSASADYNYSLFGPYGFYSDGDDTATIYTDGTGGTVQGAVNGNYLPNGINYTVTPPNLAAYKSAYGTNNLVVQLFDPTTTDNGVDEIRDPNVTSGSYTGPTAAWNGNDYTITQYTLDWDLDGNPDNPLASDHVQVGQATYGNQPQYADQWITPSGAPLNSGTFNIDLSQYTSGSFHVNVTALNGSSENGFSIRAGPPAGDTPTLDAPGTTGDVAWNALYGNDGSTVSADGVLPVNFNVNGTANIELGVFPKPNLATGATNAGTITITKFDTDVGAEGITYELVQPGTGTSASNPPVVLATYGTNYTYQGSSISLNNGNGVFSQDTIVLPPNFPGGNLYVNYTAGASDTSEWQLSYNGVQTSKGTINLIQ